MKILLIGATGQIGHALTKALAKTQHRISVLVRNKRKRSFPDNVNVIEAEKFTPASFRESLAGNEHVIYGVGLPDQFSLEKAVFDRVNYGLLESFLEVLRGSHIKSLTYISTYEVFQAADGMIREIDQVAGESHMTSYFKAMTRAYRLVTAFARETGLSLTTIHPAAVYGGLNTGYGITNYMENLINRRFWKVPFIVNGRFPVVHVDSLADAVVRSLDRPGKAYIVSDQMTTLRDIALTLRKHGPSYVPLTMPFWVAQAGAFFLEPFARLFRSRPIVAKIQLNFISKGLKPIAERAQKELGWKPLSLDEGIRIYLRERAG